MRPMTRPESQSPGMSLAGRECAFTEALLPRAGEGFGMRALPVNPILTPRTEGASDANGREAARAERRAKRRCDKRKLSLRASPAAERREGANGEHEAGRG